MFDLLKRFADLALEGLSIGLGIKEKNSNDDLSKRLRKYSKFYEENFEKIIEMCNQDLKYIEKI